jgi:hypothetical protein
MYPSSSGGSKRGSKWALVGLVVAMALGTSAQARMYQWTNPSTGTVQMSGEPPPWYRIRDDGPRVLVFESGFLVDDTSIAVSTGRRDTLRKSAFAELETRQTLDAIARVQAGTASDEDIALARREEGGVIGKAVDDVAKAAIAASKSVSSAIAENLPDVLDSGSIERLKKIIADYDRGGSSN